MIILRFRRGGIDQPGIVDAGQIYSVTIDEAGLIQAGAPVGPIGDVTILPPTVPSKIIAVGLNYGDPSQEGLSALPDEAILSFKPPSSVIATEESILLPTTSTRTDYEGELAVVVGRTAKNVEAADASRFILGYTCGNDVTARDVQRREGQWAKAKGYDTFCPLGPWIVTDVDPADVALVVRVNGGVRQSTSTSLMFFRPDQLLSYISKVMTLYPGDVILTGTPPGVGQLSPGDVVEVEIEGIGVLRNPVARSSD